MLTDFINALRTGYRSYLKDYRTRRTKRANRETGVKA